MIRFMIDTDDLSKLSGNVELLATYSDLVPDANELRKKFPDSEIILIDRGSGDPSGEASVFDIEDGCLTVEQALAKYDDAKKRGIQYLTVYHDRDIAAEVNSAFGDRKPYTWDATLDGTAFITGYDPLHTPAVIQVLSSIELDYHADGSIVQEDAWHPRKSVGVTSRMRTECNQALAMVEAADTHIRALRLLFDV